MLRAALALAVCRLTAAMPLLRQVPMIFSHDAATGYLQPSIIKAPVYDWTITQVGSFEKQLACGARAFDMRLRLGKDGEVLMHHAKIPVNTPLSTAVEDVRGWLSAHASEMVLFIVANCEGDGCKQNATKVFTDAGVATVSCQELTTLSLQDAMLRGRLDGGGSALSFVDSCTTGNYEPRITCYPPYKYSVRVGRALQEVPGALREPHWTTGCYWNSSDQAVAFDAMYLYLNRTSAVPLSSHSGFNSLQALWQETPETVPQGMLSASSLIKDEERSGLNKNLLEKLHADWFPHINLFELNNVCDQGPAIQAALKLRLTKLTAEVPMIFI